MTTGISSCIAGGRTGTTGTKTVVGIAKTGTNMYEVIVLWVDDVRVNVRVNISVSVEWCVCVPVDLKACIYTSRSVIGYGTPTKASLNRRDGFYCASSSPQATSHKGPFNQCPFSQCLMGQM